MPIHLKGICYKLSQDYNRVGLRMGRCLFLLDFTKQKPQYGSYAKPRSKSSVAVCKPLRMESDIASLSICTDTDDGTPLAKDVLIEELSGV